MSVHRKLPSLSQPCTRTLQSASRGLMSLNIHIAGNEAQCIFQFITPPPPFLIGRGVAAWLIHLPILFEDPFSVGSISGFFVHKKDLASEVIQLSTSLFNSRDHSQ